MVTKKSKLWGIAVFTLGLTLTLSFFISPPVAAAEPEKPNIILIFMDDLGYGDVGVYDAAVQDTPHLDALAAEGVRLTDFYVSASICTPSRASMLTGRYQSRTYLIRALDPDAAEGLLPWELTLAELLQQQGYATAAIGKWHLGHRPQYAPTRQGFDLFFGVPYSNNLQPLPLLRNGEVIDAAPDQRLFIRLFTEEAKTFISQAGARPFFLYLPHVAPHTPHYVSDEWARPQTHTIYQDVIRELDASIGELLAHLEALGLRDNTLVIFTSDNGPRPEHLKVGDNIEDRFDAYGRGRYNGGSAGPFRGGKGDLYEGGVRVPFIARWPAGLGAIPPGGRVLDASLTSLDLYPTLAAVAGADVPADRTLDGENVLDVWRGAARPQERPLFFLHGWRIGAMRMGQWKLHLDEQMAPTALYDLSTPEGMREEENVLADNRETAVLLRQEVEKMVVSLNETRPLAQSLQYRLLQWPAAVWWAAGAGAALFLLGVIVFVSRIGKDKRRR